MQTTFIFFTSGNITKLKLIIQLLQLKYVMFQILLILFISSPNSCYLFFMFYCNDKKICISSGPLSNQYVFSAGSSPLVYSSFKSLPSLKEKNPLSCPVL